MLVCAPAGYGKTVLLAGWARGGQRPVAWLSLDAGDNDPARFWRHCVAALDRARPGIAERVRPLLGASAPPSYEVLVTTLINELAAGPSADEVLLVLDDYHLIDSGVHESLWFLLEHKPSGLHLVLASRSDPPLPLARLRGRGQLTELRAAELFTADEAAALLRHMAAEAGAALPGAAVAALESRTEDWAAGLQLAGLSLRWQSDVAGFVAAFAGTHRHILDVLAEEVLERQTEQVRGFLLAQGQPGQALALLGRLHAAAAAQDRAGSLIEIGALRALALAASGDEDGAVDALAGTLALAYPQGYVRVFADEGPPMAALLGRLIAAQRTGQAAAKVPLGCLARLQRAFDAGSSAPGHRPAAAVHGIVEPLTSRELQILEMLAGGMSNQAIARQLVVSLDTVKKHVSHVLGKLGAASRTEAVARARQLALIP